MNRRQFLKSIGIGAALALLPELPVDVNGEKQSDAPSIKQKDDTDIVFLDDDFLGDDTRTTFLGVRTGIRSVLPIIPSIDEYPLASTISGFVRAEKTSPDDDAPVGFFKGVPVELPFGNLRYDSNDISADMVIRKWRKDNFEDLRLFTSILGKEFSDDEFSKMSENDILSLVTYAEMAVVAMLIERRLEIDTWQGITELDSFIGLDRQIKRGIVDGETGVAAPCLDSDVKDFQFFDVMSAERNIAEYLSMTEWYLRSNAQNLRLTPCEHAVVMRPELWYELTEVWPLVYAPGIFSGSYVHESGYFHDGIIPDVPKMRDWMRNELKIPINGLLYDVILDYGIFEDNVNTSPHLQSGTFASTIYFLPLHVCGLPVTYAEYIHFKDPIVRIEQDLDEDSFWTDNGMYNWFLDVCKWDCVLQATAKQRVVLKTPQLAGKLMNVAYTPKKYLMEA